MALQVGVGALMALAAANGLNKSAQEEKDYKLLRLDEVKNGPLSPHRFPRAPIWTNVLDVGANKQVFVTDQDPYGNTWVGGRGSMSKTGLSQLR